MDIRFELKNLFICRLFKLKVIIWYFYSGIWIKFDFK